MKTSIKIALTTLALLTAVSVQAQVASSGDPASTSSQNIDWNSASDLEVMLQAVEMTTPTPANTIPRNGTFFSAQHSPVSVQPWPPLPFNSANASAWSLGDPSVWLLDDLNFNYNSPSMQTKQSGGMMAMDDSGPPSPGGGDGGTNIISNGIIYPAPDYGTNTWIRLDTNSSGYMAGIISNTLSDVSYEIQYKTNLAQGDWDSSGVFVYGSEQTNWTDWNLPISTSSNVFFRIRSWQDDGSGLPIWWQEQYFGTTGVDPYGDPDGDGWNNLQEFQNGTDPTVFNTPATPQANVAFDTLNGVATVSWLPSPGPVTGYTLITHDGQTGVTTTNYLSATTTSFEDDLSGDVSDDWAGQLYAGYQLQADYANGSTASDNASIESDTWPMSLVPGPGNSVYLGVPSFPSGATAFRLTRVDAYAFNNYGDTSQNVNFDIPIAAFTNGLFLLIPDMTTNPVDSYGGIEYVWAGTIIGTNTSAVEQLNGGFSFFVDQYATSWIEPPYYDGRVQLKQNLIFLLRAAVVDSPFQWDETGITYGSQSTDIYTSPSAYEYASFFKSGDGNGWFIGQFDSFQPFEDNYLYRNFVFDSSQLDSYGEINTGVGGSYSGYPYMLSIQDPPTNQFQLPVSGTTIPALLDTNSTRWLASYPIASYTSYLGKIGVTNYIDFVHFKYVYAMTNNANNYWGLPFLSAQIATNSINPVTLYAGDSIASDNNLGGYLYPETAQPQFQTAEYDFWRVPDPYYLGHATGIPGTPDFSVTNTSGLLVCPVGGSMNIAGYAKLEVTNSYYSGVYGYLGQYFDQAYKMDDNGNVTTNTAGILSPYGNFFATQPGMAALVTMPDVDTGERGTGVVYCVSAVIDKNQGSPMDLYFAGANATSQANPATIWCDNNFDRWHTVDGSDSEQDDLGPVDIAKLPAYQQMPDCNYVDAYGEPAIPCTRDLEDYFRFWTPGVAALMKVLPANYTVQLTLSGDGQIRIFQAIEPDGGTNYLFDETTASNQVVNSASLYVGLLTQDSPVILTSTNEHFIFCGAQTGSAQIHLQVLDNNQHVLADAPAYLQIKDIKQMYERYTVGENPKIAPMSVATNQVDNIQFQYTPPTDADTPYILFVHGWNMETWEKDRFAETAFKRLYWQGYQGRFGSFRWPTGSGFTGNFGQLLTAPQEKDNYDNSEYNAWLSGTGLLNKLNDLNTEYPGHVYMLAHSMGNIVANEALRLAGSNEVVNTYVASQAAVTAHTYDDTIPNYSFDVTIEGVQFNLGPNNPNIYGDWFTGNYGGGAGQVISFYNTNDFALSRLHWQLDQLAKPDVLVAEGGSLWNYGYSGSANDPTPWNHFFKTNTVSTTVNFDIVGNLTNRYEVMSYAAQSYTTALGATAGVHHVAANVDLTTLWPSPDPLNNNYASHFFHSAEFRGDSVWEWNYWNTLLLSRISGFNLNQ